MLRRCIFTLCESVKKLNYTLTLCKIQCTCTLIPCKTYVTLNLGDAKSIKNQIFIFLHHDNIILHWGNVNLHLP